jgi:hypothetical protein
VERPHPVAAHDNEEAHPFPAYLESHSGFGDPS